MAALASQADEVNRMRAVLAAEAEAYDVEAEAAAQHEYEKAKKGYDAGSSERYSRPIVHVLRAKFTLARALCDSADRAKLRRATTMLEELLESGHNVSGVLFALALAHYRLGQMRVSRKYVERLLRREPDNKDALVFHRLVRADVTRDGKRGILVLAAAAVGVALLFRFALRRREPKFYQ